MNVIINSRAALAAASLCALVTTGCAKKDAAPGADTAATTSGSVTTPIRVTDIQVGKRVGADKRIVEPATTFGTRDTIYASVTTEGAATDARLTAAWTFDGAQAISEADEIITTQGGQHVSEFHISKATPWPAGSYKVEVKLNGASAGTREFRVQ